MDPKRDFLLVVLSTLCLVVSAIEFKEPYGRKEVICGETEMEIRLEFCTKRACIPNDLMRFIPGRNGQDLHLYDSACTPTSIVTDKDRIVVTFVTRYNQCGTHTTPHSDVLFHYQIVHSSSNQKKNDYRLFLEFQCLQPIIRARQAHPDKVYGMSDEHVFCEGDRMTLTIPQSMVPRYSPEELHLADPTCRLREEAGDFTITTSYTGCGGKVFSEGGQLLMINTVSSEQARGTITRKKPVAITFGCVYSQTARMMASAVIYPRVSVAQFEAPGAVSLPQNFELYLDILNGDFKPINDYTALKVGETMHARLTADTGVIYLGLKPVAENCYVTPANKSAEEMEKFKYYLVKNKCISDPTTTIKELENGHLYSFEVFSYAHDTTESLLVHCDAVVCDEDDKKCLKCAENNSSKRHKRSVAVHSKAVKLSNLVAVKKFG